MASGVINPVPIQQYFDNNGNPLPGGLLHFYLAGTDTRTPVFADITMLTPLSNPVVLDSAGRAPEIFLDALSYKEVLQNALGVTVWSADNITSPSAIELPPSPEGDPAIINVGSPGVTATVDVVLPTPHNNYFVYVYGNTTLRRMTPGTVNGQTVRVVNHDPNSSGVFIQHNGAGSPPLVYFYNRAQSGPTPLGYLGSALFLWRPNAWYLIAHDQGPQIVMPYSAANYVNGLGAGTWTVEAGDVKEHSYMLVGKQLWVNFSLVATSMTADCRILQVRVPFNTWSQPVQVQLVLSENGTTASALMTGQGGVFAVQITKPGVAFFATTTNGTDLSGQIWYPVV